MKKIVTKDWLASKVATDPNKVIGRALLALLRNQTAEEQVGRVTVFKNGTGFAKPDARIGTLGAQAFQKTGTLPAWLLHAWAMPKRGYPRICKYANQLNAIANANQ